MDVKLRIHRFVEGKKWVQEYTVAVKTGMTILEALTGIKEKQDPTLAFTCSCRSSIPVPGCCRDARGTSNTCCRRC